MRRLAAVFGGLPSLVTSPVLGATSDVPPDELELGKWLIRLWPGMLIVGLLVAFIMLVLLRRAPSRQRRAAIAALTLLLGLPLIVGAPLLAWNLGKEAPVMADVRAWNRLHEDVRLTDASGTTLEIRPCGYAAARLDTHRMTVASASRTLGTLGGGVGPVRYIVIDAGSVAGGDYFSETEPAHLSSCTVLAH